MPPSEWFHTIVIYIHMISGSMVHNNISIFSHMMQMLRGITTSTVNLAKVTFFPETPCDVYLVQQNDNNIVASLQNNSHS